MNPNRQDPSVAERIREVPNSLGIAYQGLRMSLAQRALGRHEEAIDEAVHDEQFYTELGHTVLDVVDIADPREGSNHPHAPKPKNALSGAAGSQAKVQAYRARATGVTLTPEQDAVLNPPSKKPPTLRRGDTEPRTNKQLEDELTVAKNLAKIRDERAAQARRARVFGDTGPYDKKSHTGSVKKQKMDAYSLFTNGDIDAYEYESELRRIDSGIETIDTAFSGEESRSTIPVAAPHPTHKGEKTIEKTATRSEKLVTRRLDHSAKIQSSAATESSRLRQKISERAAKIAAKQARRKTT